MSDIPGAKFPQFNHHPLQLLNEALLEVEAKDLEPNLKQDEILRCAEFLMTAALVEGALNILDTPGMIQKLQAPNRICHLVRGEEFYFCSNEIVFCSCRSFLERTKLDPKTVCKHLLALKLMPYLNGKPSIETISDEDFGKIIVSRAFPFA
jgi:predicted nucleic acid-binding Zn finger protein